MFFDLSTQSDLFADLSAHRTVELKLGQIHLDSSDTSARTQRPNVQHEDFSLLQLGNASGLLFAVDTNAEQASQQERADFNVGKDFRQ